MVDVLGYYAPVAAANIIIGASTAACPGTVGTPLAAPGELCIYLPFVVDAAFIRFLNPTTGVLDAATTFGALLTVSSNAAGRTQVGGSWAVTAP